MALYRTRTRYLLIITMLISHTVFGQLPPINNKAWTTNYLVSTSALDSQYLYIGGEFTFIGPNNSGQAIITKSNSNPTKNLSYVDGTIKKSIPDGNGGYYIAGGFTKVGGHSIKNLAHILSDGSVDLGWTPNPNDSVLAMEITNDYLFVGGLFTQIGGQAINYCSKLNINTGIPDLTWNPQPNGIVRALLLDGNETYIGGEFTFIGGEFCTYAAKLNATGTLNPSWLPSMMIQTGRFVNNIKKHGNQIYLTGRFILNSSNFTNFARVDLINATTDLTWQPSPNGVINSFEFTGGFAYVFGNFTTIGGKNRIKVAKINLTNGQSDLIWNPLKTSSISAIAVSNNEIYIAKYKDSTRTYFPSRVAKLDTVSGSEIPNWGTYLDGLVNCITIQNSDVHVSGFFTMLGGFPCQKVAKINLETWYPDTTWTPKPNGNVTALTVEDQSLYIGGAFSQIGGKSRGGLARLSKNDGSVDSVWNPNCWAPTVIRMGSNYIYLGGNFTQVGGVTRNRIARVNKTTGSLDLNWNPNPSGQIKDILVRSEGVYVGGSYNSIGGITKNHLSKLNLSTGAAYPNWGQEIQGLNSSVNSIIEKDSNLFIGGSFPQVGGVAIANLAKLKTSTGTLDSNWNCEVSEQIYFMKIKQNSLYIAGVFNQVGGFNYNRLAKINIISKLPDPRLKLTMRVSDGFFTFQIFEKTDSTEIIAGGLFWEINSIPRFNLASFNLENQLPNAPVLSEPFDNSLNLVQPITLKWLRNSEVERYLVEVGESDNFSNPIFVDSTVIDTAISLPSLENGKQYFWRVRGINSYGQSSFSSTWKFRTLGLLPTITQIQPFNQSINTPVSNVLFEWSVAEISQLTSKIRTTSNQKGNIEHSKENVLYWLEVTSDSNSGAFFFQDSTITASSIRLSGFNFLTNYHWRVKGKNSLGWNEFSSWSKFTTIIERPEQPNLVSPTNRDSGVVQPARLSWQSALRVEKYILQIGFDKFLTDMVFVDSLILDTSRVIPILPNLTWFYWRVIAKNIGGLSDTSDVWQFKTQGTPSVVTLLVPLNNAQFIPITDAVFKWTSAKDRTESIQNYRFELKIDTSQSNYIVLDTLLTDTVKIISGLSHKTTYFWRVGAKNEAGWGNFTTWNRFTTILKPVSSPTGLVALPESVGQIKLNWSDNSDNELGFIVYRKVGDSTSASDLVVIDSVGMNSTEFIDSTVADTTLYSYLIRAYNNDTLSAQSNFATVVTLTDIMEISWGVPKEFVLFQNYPNPFNPSTLIRFGVPKDSYVEINLYSVQGEFIHRLLQDDKSAGYYEVKLELPTLSSGIYLYQIKAIEQDSRKTFTFSRKLILMK